MASGTARTLGGIARNWFNPTRPSQPELITEARERTALTWELLLVFGMTLGLSGLRSLISLIDALSRPQQLNQQHVTLNAPQATVSLLDLFAQLAGVLQLLAWGGIGVYLLWRAGIRFSHIGLDLRRPWRDAGIAAVLAAVIGIPGLLLYLTSRALDLNLTVLPSTLTDTWWRIPALLLAAVGNAWAEEVLVVGYLLTALRRRGWQENTSLLASAVLRGSYHLYQGFGGFVGNIVMGLVFGRVWQRTNRLWALVAAHTLLDVVSFLGYALLHGLLPWLG